MPLFQPSNITPSTFAGVGGGTIAVAENVKVVWQLNGNVPMTAYKINVYDSNNVLVYSSGVIAVDTPKYSTDNKGNPVYFTHEPSSTTWADIGLIDGKEYSLQITQYWGGKTDENHSVTQFSQSWFITRTKPTLLITTINGETNFPIIESVSQVFTAKYQQSQEDSIDWVHWRLYKLNSSEDYVLIDDTGIVNTQLLNYKADNMRSGERFKIVCTIQTESGVVVSSEKEFSVNYSLVALGANFSHDCEHRASTKLSWENVEINRGESIQARVDGNYEFLSNGSLKIFDNTSIEWTAENKASRQVTTPWSLLWRGDFNMAEFFPRLKKNYSVFTSNKYTDIIVNPANKNEFTCYGENNVDTFVFENEEISTKNKFLIAKTLNVSYHKSGKRFIVTSSGSYYQSYYNDTTKFNTDGIIALTSAFNSNGDIFVVGGHEELSLSGLIYFYRTNSTTGEIISKLSSKKFNNNPVEKILFSPDSRFMIVLTKNSVSLFKYVSGGYIFLEEYSSNTEYIAFSKDSKWLAIGYNIYSLENDNPVKINFFLASNIKNGVFFDNYFLAIDGNQDYYIYEMPISSSEKPTLLVFQHGEISYYGLNVLGDNSALIWINLDSTNGSVDYFSVLSNKTSALWLDNYNFEISNNIIAYIDGVEYLYELKNNNPLFLTLSNKVEVSFEVQLNSKSLIIKSNQGERRWNISSYQNSITNIELSGLQTCKVICIESGALEFEEGYIPYWNNGTQFLTRFDIRSFEAGEFSDAKVVMDIYREDIFTGKLQKLYSVDEDSESIRDFSWLSNNTYKYYAYGRIGDRYASINEFTQEPICRLQHSYFLLETLQDEEQPNAYRVLRYWRFGNNLSQGAMSNNNTPSFLSNFTKYRLKQPTSRNSKSGVLQALISNTINGVYNDTTKQMEELYALSSSNNTFFLKDTKGNLYMVAISNAITQTINTKSNKKEVSISLSWEEIGDCEGISIVQLPTDSGFNKQEQN